MKPPLTEAQVVRYSRQILLREVGGGGQARLCGTPVALAGEATAEVALWLAAGGAPVFVEDRPLRADEAGFLGAPGDGLRQALGEEGAGPAPVGALWVASAPWAGPIPEGAGVVLGGGGDGGVAVVFGGAQSCRGCLATTVEGLQASPVELRGLGTALAALAAQRLVLGLAPGEGLLGTSADGAPGACLPLSACEVHW